MCRLTVAVILASLLGAALMWAALEGPPARGHAADRGAPTKGGSEADGLVTRLRTLENELGALQEQSKPIQTRLSKLESCVTSSDRLWLTKSADDMISATDKQALLKDLELKPLVKDERPRRALVVFKAGGVEHTPSNIKLFLKPGEAFPRYNIGCTFWLMVDGKAKAVTYLSTAYSAFKDWPIASSDVSLVWLWENIAKGAHNVRVDWKTSGGLTKISCFNSTRSLMVLELP